MVCTGNEKHVSNQARQAFEFFHIACRSCKTFAKIPLPLTAAGSSITSEALCLRSTVMRFKEASLFIPTPLCTTPPNLAWY